MYMNRNMAIYIEVHVSFMQLGTHKGAPEFDQYVVKCHSEICTIFVFFLRYTPVSYLVNH